MQQTKTNRSLCNIYRFYYIYYNILFSAQTYIYLDVYIDTQNIQISKILIKVLSTV